MPLREWTFTEEGFAKNVIPAVYQKPDRKLKAHLVGFRGVGDQFPKDVTDPTSYRCPAVVLRLEDGRKRVFLGKYFSEDDRKYVMTIYHADRARMEKKLLPNEYRRSQLNLQKLLLLLFSESNFPDYQIPGLIFHEKDDCGLK